MGLSDGITLGCKIDIFLSISKENTFHTHLSKMINCSAISCSGPVHQVCTVDAPDCQEDCCKNGYFDYTKFVNIVKTRLNGVDATANYVSVSDKKQCSIRVFSFMCKKLHRGYFRKSSNQKEIKLLKIFKSKLIELSPHLDCEQYSQLMFDCSIEDLKKK